MFVYPCSILQIERFKNLNKQRDLYVLNFYLFFDFKYETLQL